MNPTDQEPPAGPPDERDRTDSPLLCYCRRVRESAILQAIEDGHTELEDLILATGAATGCGTCRFELAALLRRTISASIGDPTGGDGVDAQSGRAHRHLLLALAFVALFLTTFVIAWKIDPFAEVDDRTTGRDTAGARSDVSTADPTDAESFSQSDPPPLVGNDRVRIVDVFGQPLANAQLQSLAPDRAPTSIRLDGDGTAIRPATTGGEYLLARHPELGPQLVPLTPFGPSRIVLSSRPGLKLRVIDANTERGVARASVRWTPRDLDARIGLESRTALEWRAETDADGFVVLRGLPECAGRVRVESAGLRTTELDVPSVRDLGDGLQPIRLAPGRSVRALLVDDSGDPMPNWSVVATSRDGGASTTSVSNADGSLRLRGLANGPFDAMLGPDQEVPLAQRYDEQRRVVLLAVPARRRIDGAAVDGGGLRLGSASVTLGASPLSLGPDGRFSHETWVTTLPLRLAASATRHVTQSVTLYDDFEGPFELRLPSAPLVLGRVIDGKGDPIAGARIALVGEDGEAPEDGRSHRTGSVGRFALDFDLEKPRGRFWIEAPGQPTILTPPIERTGSSDPIDVGAVRIPVGAALSVRLEPGDGRLGVPELRPATEGTSQLPRVELRATADGLYESGPIVAGDYVLVVMPSPIADRSPSMHEVHLTPGRHSEFRLVLARRAGDDRLETVSSTEMERTR